MGSTGNRKGEEGGIVDERKGDNKLVPKDKDRWCGNKSRGKKNKRLKKGGGKVARKEN